MPSSVVILAASPGLRWKYLTVGSSESPRAAHAATIPAAMVSLLVRAADIIASSAVVLAASMVGKKRLLLFRFHHRPEIAYNDLQFGRSDMIALHLISGQAAFP